MSPMSAVSTIIPLQTGLAGAQRLDMQLAAGLLDPQAA